MPINTDMLLENITNLLEYKTKSGKEIDLERIEDSEGDKNRGWQVDKIVARVDGEEVGYIKVSYIPHNRFMHNYDHIFSFLDKIDGGSYLPFNKRDVHPTKLSSDEQRQFLKRIMHAKRLVSYGGERIVDDMSDKEVIDKIYEIEEMLMKGASGKKFKEFKNFHKDKPLVDYIHVNDEWRRQRIGEAMYQEAARWMKEKGMKLYASGMQTDAAKASWDHMKKTLRVRPAKRGRRTLDVA